MSGHRKWSEIRTSATAMPEHHEPLRTLGELRRDSGLSQHDVAEELGVSQASVSKIERQDYPQVSTLMRYLDALGANLELRVVFPDRSARLYFLGNAEAADEESADRPESVGIATEVAPS